MTVVLADILPTRPGDRTFTLADRRERECAWPVDGWTHPNADASRRPFCCAEVEPGSPYCPCHTWDAYPGRRAGARPNEPMEKAA